MEIRILFTLLSITGIITIPTTAERAYAEDPVFGRPVMLTNTASVQFPEIAVSGSNVYVVWEGGRDQGGNAEAEIYLRTSTDNGETFGPTINLSNIFGFSMGPMIAVSGSNVYVGWTESVVIDRGEEYGQQRFIWEPYEIFFTSSNDNGATFGSVVNLSNSKTTESYVVGIAASGNNVYVLSVEAGVGILFMVSSDNGATFSTPIALDVGYNPRMGASGSHLYVLGTKGLITSNDSGASFGPRVNIGPYEVASIAASGSNVYIAYGTNPWGNTNENPEVMLRISNDNGSTFGGATNLSNDPWTSRDARIGAFENNVYAVWLDTSPQKNGNFDVLFRASNDNGATFGNILNPTNKAGWSAAPRIAASENYVHAIWLSKVVEDEWYYDIAYTRSPPTENSLVPIPPSDPSPSPSPSPDPSPSPSPSPDPSDTLEIGIDVKPASTSNTVNCANQKGSISVGIYTEDGFDAQDVDVSTIELQGVDAKKYVLKDLDSDGDLDGVARFKKADLCESGEILAQSITEDVTLAGLTNSGMQFEGSDIIRFRR